MFAVLKTLKQGGGTMVAVRQAPSAMGSRVTKRNSLLKFFYYNLREGECVTFLFLMSSESFPVSSCFYPPHPYMTSVNVYIATASSRHHILYHGILKKETPK